MSLPVKLEQVLSKFIVILQKSNLSSKESVLVSLSLTLGIFELCQGSPEELEAAFKEFSKIYRKAYPEMIKRSKKVE